MNRVEGKKPTLKTRNSAELSWALVNEVSQFARPEFIPVLVDAIQIATALHEGQWRGNRGPHQRTPYIEHPLRNALRAVLADVTDPVTILANIFHDVVEDQAERMVLSSDPNGPTLVRLAKGDQERLQELALSWLANHFRENDGDEVAELVKAVTNPIDEQGVTKAEKRIKYAGNVRFKIRGKAKVFIIKLMDFFDNGAGLHHNDIPGNEKMVKHLVIKYSPMPDMFLDELEANFEEISALISAEGLAEIRTKLANTKIRLAAMAEKHGLLAEV